MSFIINGLHNTKQPTFLYCSNTNKYPFLKVSLRFCFCEKLLCIHRSLKKSLTGNGEQQHLFQDLASVFFSKYHVQQNGDHNQTH